MSAVYCDRCKQMGCKCPTGNFRSLRSGRKEIKEVVINRGGPRRSAEHIYPAQAERSTTKRKPMTGEDTESIEAATLEGGAGDRTYLHKARSLAPIEEEPRFLLKDMEVARCHIVADSNARLIITEIYDSQKRAFDLLGAPGQAGYALPGNVVAFIDAMTAGRGAQEIKADLLGDITKGNKAHREAVMHDLSHGAGNLFFGDANRNGVVLHGLDVPIENGSPTPNAAAIIAAVGGLGYQSVIRFCTVMASLTPTVARVDGLAVSSSSTAAYPASLRFEEPVHPAALARASSEPPRGFNG